MSDLVILLPMLGRPWTVRPLLDSIEQTVPDARVLFLLTPNDGEVLSAVQASGREYLTIPHAPGDYPRKINRGIASTNEPLIFTGACDILFRAGWYEAAVAKLAPGVGVVGTNDLTNPSVMAGEHATHMLVTRAYVNDFGTIDERGKFYHEGYPHEYCDSEAVETAKRRRAWAMALDSVVEHMHPLGGKAPMDNLYAQSPDRTFRGRVLFESRRRLWA